MSLSFVMANLLWMPTTLTGKACEMFFEFTWDRLDQLSWMQAMTLVVFSESRTTEFVRLLYPASFCFFCSVLSSTMF